jgi:hypothetical protein
MRGFLAIFLSALCVSAPAAGLVPCDKPVRFTAGWFDDPELDITKPSTEVTQIGASAGLKGTQIGHVIVQTKLAVLPQASCAGFVVRLEYIKPVLRVASELPPESCAYAFVLAHEYTHVRIYREMARQFRELSYPWPKGATSDTILAYAKVELDRLTQAQVRFDSPEEYAKSQTMCGGEILRLIKTPAPPIPAKKAG